MFLFHSDIFTFITYILLLVISLLNEVSNIRLIVYKIVVEKIISVCHDIILPNTFHSAYYRGHTTFLLLCVIILLPSVILLPNKIYINMLVYWF